jgi:hypothetical protein
MTNETIGIYDHATGENEVREMTKAEQDQRNAEGAASLAKKQAAKIAKENTRATKIAAFTKLGLTEQEIEALVPTEIEPIVLPIS